MGGKVQLTGTHSSRTLFMRVLRKAENRLANDGKLLGYARTAFTTTNAVRPVRHSFYVFYERKMRSQLVYYERYRKSASPARFETDFGLGVKFFELVREAE